MGACCAPDPYPSAEDKKTYKVLFLGSGGCGKSTLFKQLKKTYGTGFTAKDKHDARSGIAFFVIDTMQTLLEDENCHIDEFKDEEVKTAAQQIKSLKANSTPSLDAATTNSIKILWRQQEIKDLFDETAKLYLNGPCAYFFDSIDRISDPNFDPTDQDILMQRRPTVGINEQFILKEEHEGIRFQMVDVGGQKNERKKWIHQFENFSAIVWVVSLSAFDEPLYEDENVNSLQDAINLFNEIINQDGLQWFKQSSLFIVFNKKDVFQQKITSKSLKTCFEDEKWAYDEDACFNDCSNDEEKIQKNIQFIKEVFMQQVKEETKQVITFENFEMCAYEEDKVKEVFAKILGRIVEKNKLAPP
eukprot:CAMPEP_0197026556 /NCGR_PEP_ID=MMETSP1384-20130603/6611_1 /TAXON_ID=29189 /ORGANISM="Ammonia sp." /LENGTH=358 /DNA_ID=CAMNT_0042455243 /DNA_START=111 /DNA_END=1187 /DNA_ORIENTATION=+